MRAPAGRTAHSARTHYALCLSSESDLEPYAALAATALSLFSDGGVHSLRVS